MIHLGGKAATPEQATPTAPKLPSKTAPPCHLLQDDRSPGRRHERLRRSCTSTSPAQPGPPPGKAATSPRWTQPQIGWAVQRTGAGPRESRRARRSPRRHPLPRPPRRTRRARASPSPPSTPPAPRCSPSPFELLKSSHHHLQKPAARSAQWSAASSPAKMLKPICAML
jgi:hypothetical protein